MTGFLPDTQQTDSVPFFEDARAEHGVVGQGTEKGIEKLLVEVKANMGLFGGYVTGVTQGKFDNTPPRYGYRIDFVLGDKKGRIDLMGLPMKKYTKSRKLGVLKQCLYVFNMRLKTEWNLRLLDPNSSPLLPYLLVDGETLVEKLRQSQNIPRLKTWSSQQIAPELIEGELVVDNEE